jgi:hypothetical protein
MKKNIKNKHPQNPKGYYNVNLVIRGVKCNVKIINESFNEYRVEVNAKQNLTQEFLNYIAYYMEKEGFYEEAQKHNLFWNC